MKIRILSALPLLALTAITLASAMTIWSASGRGILVDEEGHRAHFNLSGHKSHHNNRYAIEGSCVIETGNTERALRLGVMIRQFDTVENNAYFIGPAVLRVTEGSVSKEWRGTARGHAVSKRHPGETGEPDRLRVTFTYEDGRTWSFAGKVAEGDILVSKAVNY